MTNYSLSKSDAAMQQSLAALEEHISTMDRCAHNVQTITEDIARAYQATSASIFVQKMADWMDQYNIVAGKFQQLAQDNQSINTVLKQAEDDAHQSALSLSVSSGLGI